MTTKKTRKDFPRENDTYGPTRLASPSWERSSDPRWVDFTVDLDADATAPAIGRDVAKWITDLRKMRRLEKPNLGGNTHEFPEWFRGQIPGWVDCYKAELDAEWYSLCKVTRPNERKKRLTAIFEIFHPGKKVRSPARLAETASKPIAGRRRRTVACELLAAAHGVSYETIRAYDRKQPPRKTW